jgi:hypothetical protein
VPVQGREKPDAICDYARRHETDRCRDRRELRLPRSSRAREGTEWRAEVRVHRGVLVQETRYLAIPMGVPVWAQFPIERLRQRAPRSAGRSFETASPAGRGVRNLTATSDDKRHPRPGERIVTLRPLHVACLVSVRSSALCAPPTPGRTRQDHPERCAHRETARRNRRSSSNIRSGPTTVRTRATAARFRFAERSGAGCDLRSSGEPGGG